MVTLPANLRKSACKSQCGAVEDGFQEDVYYEVEDQDTVRYRSKKTSKGFLTEEYAIKFSFLSEISEKFGINIEDYHEGFASQTNHRLGTFWTKQDNSFSKSWQGLRLYLNPPFSLMDKVSTKLIADVVEETVIVYPCWKSAPWYTVLEHFRVKTLLYARGTRFFEYVDEFNGEVREPGGIQWDVMVSLVSFKKFAKEMARLGTSVQPEYPKQDCTWESDAIVESGESALSKRRRRRWSQQAYSQR